MFESFLPNQKLKAKIKLLEKEVAILEEDLYRTRVHYLTKSETLSILTDKWNNLVRRVNAKGGEEFLRSTGQSVNQFSDEDIKKLLLLCHPDKHNGKKMAEDMTAVLLLLRR